MPSTRMNSSKPEGANSVTAHDLPSVRCADRLAFKTEGICVLDFVLEGHEAETDTVLTVNASASVTPVAASAVTLLDVLVNRVSLSRDLVVPGGGRCHEVSVTIPGRLLRQGFNTLRLRSVQSSRDRLHVHRVTVDSPKSRGTLRQTLTAHVAQGLIHTYSTERRSPTAHAWTPAPPVRLHLFPGADTTTLSQLSLRNENGAEAAIGFRSTMTGFYGHHRESDGSYAEFRGVLADSTDLCGHGLRDSPSHPDRTAAEWQPSAGLCLTFDDGESGVKRLTWRNQAGQLGGFSS
ncbi:hypothetical protein [Streptomyces sp. NPDC098781]|uniref:hypothetical protein n=1 Tax=Streptomyces sp. NPDC098781 TaxID=3366097 RepID=UPI003824A676